MLAALPVSFREHMSNSIDAVSHDLLPCPFLTSMPLPSLLPPTSASHIVQPVFVLLFRLKETMYIRDRECVSVYRCKCIQM